jgi:hypothetical protein
MRDAARDYSAEVFVGIDARDRPAARHGPLDGAGDLEAGGRGRQHLLAAVVRQEARPRAALAAETGAGELTPARSQERLYQNSCGPCGNFR